LWEGTNISEGRGTTQPFEIFGAPFIDTEFVLTSLARNQMPGATLRHIVFEPTSNKWKDTPCKGFQIHVTAPHIFKPYLTTLKLLQAVLFHHQNDFKWKPPPYEYEFNKKPIDLIIGDEKIRRRIEGFENIDTIEASWKEDLEAFKQISSKFHLYA
jgi:uncharacterized protein YbbC (DUF1343 family)